MVDQPLTLRFLERTLQVGVWKNCREVTQGALDGRDRD